MEEYKAKKEARLPTKIILIDDPDKEHRPKKLVHPALASKEREKLYDLEIIQYAYKFFNTFKGLVVNLIFSFRESYESLEMFNLSDPEEALRIIEVELGFLYDALFTKIAVKGDRSKSVLFDASRLAKDLKRRSYCKKKALYCHRHG